MKQKASMCCCINPQRAHIVNVDEVLVKPLLKTLQWSQKRTEKGNKYQQICGIHSRVDETVKKWPLWLKKVSEEDMMLLSKIRNSREKDAYCFSEYMEEMEMSPCKIIGQHIYNKNYIFHMNLFELETHCHRIATEFHKGQQDKWFQNT